MTTKVTSIAQARTASRRRQHSQAVNGRLSTALMVMTAALIVIGIVATLSASSVVGLAAAEDRFFFVKRQLLGVGLGAVALFLTIRIDYRFYRRIALAAYAVALLLLVLVLYSGVSVRGSQRWLDVGWFNIQVSELAKPAVVLSLAVVLDKKQQLLADFWHFLAPVAAVLVPVGVLVMLQPDLGTTMVLGSIGVAVILTSTTPVRHGLLVGGGAIALGSLLAVVEPYRRARITGFLNPWADAAGAGYQVIQGYLALGTGGVFGLGLGNSRARWFFLPNAHTDFIFAIIGEETGLLGAMVVLLLFLLLTLIGWIVTVRAPDGLGRMMAAGITAWFTVQAFVNVGGVLGMLPITGITLPFVSYGGSSLIVTMAAMGILINIASQGQTKPKRR